MFSSSDAKFVVLAFSSLFSVINPIQAAPIFVSMTADALRKNAGGWRSAPRSRRP